MENNDLISTTVPQDEHVDYTYYTGTHETQNKYTNYLYCIENVDGEETVYAYQISTNLTLTEEEISTILDRYFIEESNSVIFTTPEPVNFLFTDNYNLIKKEYHG
jgi:hypothetical protein